MLILYKTDNCRYCELLKKYLDSQNKTYQEKHIAWDDSQAWDQLCQLSGMKTVPQLFNDQQFLGGYDHEEKATYGDGFYSLKKRLTEYSDC